MNNSCTEQPEAADLVSAAFFMARRARGFEGRAECRKNKGPSRNAHSFENLAAVEWFSLSPQIRLTPGALYGGAIPSLPCDESRLEAGRHGSVISPIPRGGTRSPLFISILGRGRRPTWIEES